MNSSLPTKRVGPALRVVSPSFGVARRFTRAHRGTALDSSTRPKRAGSTCSPQSCPAQGSPSRHVTAVRT